MEPVGFAFYLVSVAMAEIHGRPLPTGKMLEMGDEERGWHVRLKQRRELRGV